MEFSMRRVRDVVQLVECSPSRYKALGSIPSTTEAGHDSACLEPKHLEGRGRKIRNSGSPSGMW